MKLRVVLLAAAAFAWLVFAATVPLWITNPVRAQSQPATVFLNPTTVGGTQITASAIGTPFLSAHEN
jgi:hypothetical protein